MIAAFCADRTAERVPDDAIPGTSALAVVDGSDRPGYDSRIIDVWGDDPCLSGTT
jgi:hypothetical protein